MPNSGEKRSETGSAPGAAARPAPSRGPKLLRIGVIPSRQVARIDDERLIGRSQPVTVGKDPKNTFVFPTSKLPDAFTLFEPAGQGRYTLRFSEKMDGKITFSDREFSFGELKEGARGNAGRAQKKGDLYEVSLDESTRGKVLLGEITMLFQFVPPPAPVARPLLPKEAQGDLLSQIDRFFATIFLVVFLFHSVVAFLAWTRIVPEDPDFEEDNPYLEAIKQPPIIVAEAPLEIADVGTEEVVTDEGDGSKDSKPVEKAGGKGDGGPKGDVSEKVRSVGAIGALGRLRAGGGALADLYGDAGNVSSDADKAFSSAGGVQVAGAGTDLGAGLRPGDGAGGGTGELVGLNAGDAGAKGVSTAVTPGTKGPEKKVTASLKTGGVDIEEGAGGALDSAGISSVVSRRKSAIQACYERALGENEGLQGKITVRFTISEAGRVISSSAREDTVGSSAVTSCVLGIIDRLKFPENPGGGNVTAEFPFIFSKQS
jgi:hypothetical protein